MLVVDGCGGLLCFGGGGWLAFGTGEGLLRYGICAPCKKQAPGVRDAFSEAFGVKTGFSGTEEIFGTGSPLLRYGTGQVPRKQPRDARGAVH